MYSRGDLVEVCSRGDFVGSYYEALIVSQPLTESLHFMVKKGDEKLNQSIGFLLFRGKLCWKCDGFCRLYN
ncbi:hypothetical protein G4B88_024947 [Cannabis sativa]|uniref:Uncharacterized protein n=1 Tax=Cannabis sativa TaxID=3483 RepID=A0A7J6GBJ2_CANSA|nr:hypothetical protein G4B88_024947 [Cannabis sativa]